jgi:hypothetical protein
MKKPKLSLQNVTLLCVTGVNYKESLFALRRSMAKIDFAEVKLIGSIPPKKMPPGIKFEKAVDSQLDSIDSYSWYCIYNLWRHVKTSHVLIVQADGYVLTPKAWHQNFLSYDYIGAPWKISDEAYIDPFGNHQRVGNGGFSLRSKKLLDVPNQTKIPWEINTNNFYNHMGVGLYSEDGNICVHNRHLFEAAGCTFAPLEVALSFSIEQKTSEYDGRTTFGFHKKIPTIWMHLREKIKFVLDDGRYKYG